MDQDIVFGEHARSASNVNLDPGVYPAIVESATLSEETKTDRNTQEQYTQKYVTVFFRVKGPESVERLRRKYPLNFGRGTDTTAWTDFLSAITGIPSKNKDALRQVRSSQIIEKRCRIGVKAGNPGYLDVTEIYPHIPANGKPNGSTAAPKPAAPAPAPAARQLEPTRTAQRPLDMPADYARDDYGSFPDDDGAFDQDPW